VAAAWWWRRDRQPFCVPLKWPARKFIHTLWHCVQCSMLGDYYPIITLLIGLPTEQYSYFVTMSGPAKCTYLFHGSSPTKFLANPGCNWITKVMVAIVLSSPENYQRAPYNIKGPDF
jgi:hypothetical protein